jgi:peroxiredoxin
MKMAEHLFQRKWLGAIVSAALAGALIAMLLLFFPATKRVAGPGDRGAVIGTPSEAEDPLAFSFYDQPRALPELHFMDSEGHALSLTDFRTRPVLLNIWATWCVPCRVEMPAMERLYTTLAPRGFAIAAVSVDEGPPEDVRKFGQELSLSFDLLQDRSTRIQQLYQTTGVPESFLLDRHGVIVKRVIGAHDWSSPANRALVERLLNEPGT